MWHISLLPALGQDFKHLTKVSITNISFFCLMIFVTLNFHLRHFSWCPFNYQLILRLHGNMFDSFFPCFRMQKRKYRYIIKKCSSVFQYLLHFHQFIYWSKLSVDNLDSQLFLFLSHALQFSIMRSGTHFVLFLINCLLGSSSDLFELDVGFYPLKEIIFNTKCVHKWKRRSKILCGYHFHHLLKLYQKYFC